MIAMALSCNPLILIADEPTTAVDVTTQAQVLRLLRRLQQERNSAIIFITHDLGVIAQMADYVTVMYLGLVMEQGPVDRIFHDPKHPYTQALLESIPSIHMTPRANLPTISGSIPHPFNRPAGCPFHPRCTKFMPGLCDQRPPSCCRSMSMQRVSCFLYHGQPQGSCRGGGEGMTNANAQPLLEAKDLRKFFPIQIGLSPQHDRLRPRGGRHQLLHQRR